MTIKTLEKKAHLFYPLISPRERLSLLESARGMWKNKKPDPLQELKKMRRERDRKLPILGSQKI